MWGTNATFNALGPITIINKIRYVDSSTNHALNNNTYLNNSHSAQSCDVMTGNSSSSGEQPPAFTHHGGHGQDYGLQNRSRASNPVPANACK
jgi:hypothetical protein